MIDGLTFDTLMADKAFDADHLRQPLHERGTTAVICLMRIDCGDSRGPPRQRLLSLRDV